MDYMEYSTVIDTALVVALAVIVWVAYRELRARKLAAKDKLQAQ